jgi:tetratricopeptide (TPR) repeat protein
MSSEVEVDGASRFAPQLVRAGKRIWAGRLAFWILILGLVGLNAWWVWDARPLESSTTISGWIERKHLNEAERELRRWLRQSPYHGEARTLLAQVLAARGDYLGSAKQLHRVPRWWPTKGEALVLEGQAFLNADRARDAEAAWKACMVDDPLHLVPAPSLATAARELIGLYRLEGRDDEARAVLWTLYDRAEPASHPSLLARLLNLYLEHEPPADAADMLRHLIETTPDDWEARRALARAEQARGQSAEASRHILACLNAQPTSLRVWRDRLAILLAQGDQKGLTAAVAQLPPDADHDAELWKYRGLTAVSREDWTAAANAFAEALKHQPGDAKSHDHLARIAERLGNPNQADWHRRQSHALQAARSELPHSLRDALQAIRNPRPVPTAAVTRLISLCKTLGLSREAEAWSQFLPPSAP